MKPYYADDLVTIYHGDCREVMAGLPPKSVDATITDAPYNAGFLYGDGTDDARPWADYARWLNSAIALMERLSVGPVLVYVSVRGMTELTSIRRPWWVGAWVREGAGNPAGDNRGMLILPTWEPCVMYGDPRPFAFSTADVWRSKTLSDRNGHPCPKPLSLMRAMIHRTPFVSILDPFAGSGTTLVAAKDAGRHAIGIEIEERYCEIAANRCRQEVLGLTA